MPIMTSPVCLLDRHSLCVDAECDCRHHDPNDPIGMKMLREEAERRRRLEAQRVRGEEE